MRPLSPIIDQPGALRIAQDVVRFLLLGLIPPQAVIEKIPLPADAQHSCSEFLELRDFPRQRMFQQWKPDQAMHMIGHNHEETAPPDAVVVSVSDRLEQCRGAIGAQQVIRATRRRADRDEKRRLLRWDAQRCLVRQTLAIGIAHRGSMSCCGRLGPAVPTIKILPVGSAGLSRPCTFPISARGQPGPAVSTTENPLGRVRSPRRPDRCLPSGLAPKSRNTSRIWSKLQSSNPPRAGRYRPC